MWQSQYELLLPTEAHTLQAPRGKHMGLSLTCLICLQEGVHTCFLGLFDLCELSGELRSCLTCSIFWNVHEGYLY